MKPWAEGGWFPVNYTANSDLVINRRPRPDMPGHSCNVLGYLAALTKYRIRLVRYCLFSGILASCRLLLILGRTLAYHSQANRTTSPSASYGVGISEYPGRAVGCRR